MREGEPLNNAIVYRQRAGQTVAEPIQSRLNGVAFKTDEEGYLRGLGQLGPNDRLIALFPVTSTVNFPITATGRYTAYQTSAPPSVDGLDGTAIESGGVHTLTVSADNYLILFNLAVSLEWDARNDPLFMAQLKDAIRFGSQVLYDATNGQAALGEVEIFHNKGRWTEADIVIRASNRTRPVATLGGFVGEPVSETVKPSAEVFPFLNDPTTISSSANLTGSLNADGLLESWSIPGQISMPPRWSALGNNQAQLGEDWGRVLAHELGHYLFGIPDNYLGISNAFEFGLVDCPGSLMDNPYFDQNSEFLEQGTNWVNGCGETIQAQYLDRSDWDSVTIRFPDLKPPAQQAAQPGAGPNNLPLAVTRFVEYAPEASPVTLNNNFFPLVNGGGSPIFIPNGKLGVTLWKNVDNVDPADDYVIDLGSTIPSGAGVEAWGAEPGDRLCVLESGRESPRFGCIDAVGQFPESIHVETVTAWSPQIEISPISTQTVAVTVTRSSSDEPFEALEIQLLTPVGRSSNSISVTADTDLRYTAVLTAPDGAYYGHIALKADLSAAADDTVYAVYPFYNIFGWEGKTLGWGGKTLGWGGKTLGWGGKTLGWGARGISWAGKTLGWGGPTVSQDAQISIFPLQNPFGQALEFSLQQVSSAPDLPAYLTAVGQAYRVQWLQDNPQKAAVVFTYLADDIRGGENNEQYLAIYFRPDGDASWKRLETDVDYERNFVTAVMPDEGRGMYSLAMARPLGPLTGNQLNLVSWPLERSMPVEEALSHIDGIYDVVYHQTPESNEWALFVPGIDAPFVPVVNTLTEMRLGSYWLSVKEDVPDLLGPVDYIDESGRALEVNAQVVPTPTVETPPMVIYGFFGPNVQAEAGDQFWARIGGQECGRSQVITIAGQPAFVLQIAAASPDRGCGTTGAEVRLFLGEDRFSQDEFRLAWDNRSVGRLDIGVPPIPPTKYYMPSVAVP